MPGSDAHGAVTSALTEFGAEIERWRNLTLTIGCAADPASAVA